MAKNNQWPRGAVANKMTTKVPLAYEHQALADIRKNLEKNIPKLDTINYIYVINKENKLLGAFSIKELFRNKPETNAKSLIKKKIFFVHPHTSQEKAAYFVVKNNIKAIPIVDQEQKFLGVLPSDQVNMILQKARNKSLLQMAGINKEHFEYEDVLQTPILISYKHRVPWLIFGIIGGIILANLIGLFESTLKDNLILAGFIPVITYISNAVAIQVQMLFIRDMAMQPKIHFRKYFSKQIIISFLIALTCAIVLIGSSLLGWIHSYTIMIIGLAMIITILFAVVVALFIPYLLKKLKFDPGIASGPFSTIIQDTSSVLIYLLITSLLL